VWGGGGGVNQALQIRDAVEGDHPQLLRLNQEWVHFLSPLTPERLRSLHRMAWHCRVIALDTGVSGFLLALREGAAYDSPNYRWFAARYPDFVYIDRIVIDGKARGQRLGQRLYEDLFQRARAAQVRRITCEFDVDPPNEASRRFHEHFGFREVGRQQVADGKKSVSLQEATL
jgi:predicted GNAT superfamily acetyltransferase